MDEEGLGGKGRTLGERERLCIFFVALSLSLSDGAGQYGKREREKKVVHGNCSTWK